MTNIQLINSDANKAFRTLITTKALNDTFVSKRAHKDTTKEQIEEDKRVLSEMNQAGLFSK